MPRRLKVPWLSAALTGLLAGCATPPAPEQPAPGQALLTLHAPPADYLDVQRLDGTRLDTGGPALQLSPGAHDLLLRYQYDSRQGSGLFGDPRQVVCNLRLRYTFEAGQRYRLEVRPLVLQAQGWLYGPARDKPLTRAEVVRCRPF